MADLPPYNAGGHCPQCDHDDVTTDYTDGWTNYCQSTYAPPVREGARPVCHYHRGPHHHRQCRRCSFRWAEATLNPSMAMTRPS